MCPGQTNPEKLCPPCIEIAECLPRTVHVRQSTASSNPWNLNVASVLDWSLSVVLSRVYAMLPSGTSPARKQQDGAQ